MEGTNKFMSCPLNLMPSCEGAQSLTLMLASFPDVHVLYRGSGNETLGTRLWERDYNNMC